MEFNFVLIAFIGAVIFGFWAYLLLKADNTPKEYFYEPAGPLLTAAENNFYLVLKDIVPSDYVLTFKVRIGDVLKVRKGLDKKETFKLRAKVQQKHFDFVVCRKKDKRVVCCIELNDSSHNRADRKRRDKFVRSACKAAGMPLLEVKNRRSYVKSDLKKQLNSVLSGSTIIDNQDSEPEAIQRPVTEFVDNKVVEKLATSKMAAKYGCSTDEFIQMLVDSMYMQFTETGLALTDFGRNMGGEQREHPSTGKYVVWPEDLPLTLPGNT
ncbi:DUF2726 domain-containing protein [Pseudoalteromonas luteoviolacea]|uniref:DUF2726 domain-containing protein n=1 Tax=Pseudoalteromonas luteoviolacea TaxID=43657 RepID=UPI001B37E62E|nr:DUF2726 domain-containing protein [Pseudoalteromonas luteoviolacea]MBQ4840140.1 DUF2726 domain-containing protein [Pseudoalteromonas luteoviolacea]